MNNHISRDQIAIKITKMILTLHNQGYESLYLYSGWSPNGMNWRYEIGIAADNGQWTTDNIILEESISHGSPLPWGENTDTVRVLAEKFIEKYELVLKEARKTNKDYINWYMTTVNNLYKDDPLTLYADYDHEYYDELLSTAPNYIK